MSSVPPDQEADPEITVFYDGACPLCRREIAVYRRRDAGSQIGWRNLSDCSAASLPAGLSRDDALARFHVVRRNGELLSGAAAFAEMWAHTPGFRLLGRLARRPVVRRGLDAIYEVFLRWRPALQRLVS